MGKLTKLKMNRGMTYVELIVVLSIFAVLSSVVMFSYGDFQAKIDIKNLASDIAIKIVEAQKSSLNGALPVAGYNEDTWKPSYGVYFDTSIPNQFVYFANLDELNNYDPANEELDTIIITKNNLISNIDSYSNSTLTPITDPLAILFRRPNSSAIFTSTSLTSDFEYIQITVSSPNGKKAFMKIYPSGRVQVD